MKFDEWASLTPSMSTLEKHLAAVAWNAAIDAAIVAINYRDQGTIHLDVAEELILALRAPVV